MNFFVNNLEMMEFRDRRQVEVEELSKLISGYENEIKDLETEFKVLLKEINNG